MSSEFQGRWALVTGAAGGIGRALAEQLALAGARLLLVDKQAAAVDAVAALLRARGAHCVASGVDLTGPEATSELVQMAETQLGPIDYLVHAAGVLHPAPVLGATPAQWEETFAVNARAVFFLTQQVALGMKRRSRGAVVAVSSNAAAVPRAGLAVYAASKAAANAAIRCLGLELAAHGVRCNVVTPGSTRTAMLEQLGASPERILQGDLESFKLGIPLGRIALPQDVARGVCFLLSDQARHITLHDLRIDGGATLGA